MNVSKEVSDSTPIMPSEFDSEVVFAAHTANGVNISAAFHLLQSICAHLVLTL